jgi:hypothetical protein
LRRCHSFQKYVHGALSAYKQIYDEIRRQTKQTTMDIFLKRVTPPQEEPQAHSLGSIPEECIVIIGDDSSMQVIAPEDPPVGEAMKVETVILMILTLCGPTLLCVLIFNKKV